ncbi:sulfatase-like hydrolase/transferase [Prosthecobacter sp. SYSU 5D2]|uniref:sulfatase-like hydrolase/transferase n=1 Tax=Prosthecobacter sp. SYSU 5D2 TaxID=3134134 RepID=UPI0031FEDA94
MKPARLLFLLLTLTATGPAGAADSKPNILLLFVDNVGYGDLGCYGNPEVKTPHLDRLAAEGVRCTDFYTGAPSCTPSRGAILTGRHPERNGLNYQLSPEENMGGTGLPLTEKILPQYLKPLGYKTAAFGKWNLGFAPGYRPTDRGFDEFLGHMSGNIHYYKHLYRGQNDMRKGSEPIDLTGRYATDLFADAAIDFIQRQKASPWFIYIPFNAAHFISTANTEPGESIEWQVSAKYLALYGSPPDEPDQKIRFQAVLTALDEAIGRILTAVDAAGVREQTMILCISDNGAFMLKDRGLEVQSNRPLRDGGITTHEGGIRVPAIVRWPAKIKAGTVCQHMLSSLDVLPLALAISGGDLPQDRFIDGKNPLPALLGESPSPHTALHWVWNQGRKEQWRSLRDGNYKLTRRADTEPWQLYDLSKDISETHDLASSMPEKVASMSENLSAWHKSVLDDPTRSRSLRDRPESR